jgi:hypothetical protein
MTTGCLIDLDHAKIDLKHADKDIVVSGPEPLAANFDQQDEQTGKVRLVVASMIETVYHPAGIDEEALSALLTRFKSNHEAFAYLDYICKQKSSLKRDQPVSALNLRFHVI